MKQLRAVILVGAPASGKTTYALSDAFSGFEYVSPAMYNNPEAIRRVIKQAQARQRNIIIDDCNGTKEERGFFIDILNSETGQIMKYQTECHHMRTRMLDIRDNGLVRQARGGCRLNKSHFIEYKHNLVTPEAKEGFSTIVDVPFVRKTNNEFNEVAVFFSFGSVWYSNGNKLFPTNPDDVRIFPDVHKVLCRYYREGYKFIAVSNFPEIGEKRITEQTAQECMVEAVKQLPVPIDEIYYSSHPASVIYDGTLPNPKFAHEASNKYGIDLSRSIMVGHSETEKRFAELAGFGEYAPRQAFFWNGFTRIRDRKPDSEVRKVFGK